MFAGIVINALKGKWGFVALGFLLGWAWLAGAIRLAKPDSFWARRWYGLEKMQRARERFAEAPGSTPWGATAGETDFECKTCGAHVKGYAAAAEHMESQHPERDLVDLHEVMVPSK